jgi:hypothetical protein
MPGRPHLHCCNQSYAHNFRACYLRIARHIHASSVWPVFSSQSESACSKEETLTLSRS